MKRLTSEQRAALMQSPEWAAEVNKAKELATELSSMTGVGPLDFTAEHSEAFESHIPSIQELPTTVFITVQKRDLSQER